MKYVMSDIHGEYEKYLAMMEKLNLKADDKLYVLGDVLDRGPQPFAVLEDMMKRPNVIPLLGNHEWMARDLLGFLVREVTDASLADAQKGGQLLQLMLWMNDGGSSTISDFRKLSLWKRSSALEYLDTFRRYEMTHAGGRGYVLVHAGLKNFSEDRPMSSYGIEELVEGRRDPSQRYFSDSDIFVVSGHTPTLLLTGRPEVIMEHNNIMIDCGATYEGGRLAAVCLDALETFYV